MRLVPASEVDITNEFIFAHFPVIKEERCTTKTRPVYDSSAIVRGKCYNDYALPGPKLQRDLVEVIYLVINMQITYLTRK